MLAGLLWNTYGLTYDISNMIASDAIQHHRNLYTDDKGFCSVKVAGYNHGDEYDLWYFDHTEWYGFHFRFIVGRECGNHMNIYGRKTAVEFSYQPTVRDLTHGASRAFGSVNYFSYGQLHGKQGQSVYWRGMCLF